MSAATLTGLGIVLFGLFAVVLMARGTEESKLRDSILSVVGMMALVVVLLTIVMFWEKQPLSSIGLKPPTLDSVFWGVGIVVAYIFLISPLLAAMPGWFGLKGLWEENEDEELQNLPAWYISLTFILAGIGKEILFTGFTIERLLSLTGNVWLICFASAAAYTFAYSPVIFRERKWGGVMQLLLSGLLAAALYIWFRDLTPLIVVHVVINTVWLVGWYTQQRETAE